MVKRFLTYLRFLRKPKLLTRESEANRCAISARDCDAAIEYLEAYLELQEKDEASQTSEFVTHREGLLIAAIVSYSRAFKYSYGEPFAAPRLKVNVGKVFCHDKAKIDLHKVILIKRDKAVAHSDWEYHKSEVREATKREVWRRNTTVDYGKDVNIKMFKNIAEMMRSHFRLEMYLRDVASVK